MNNDTCKINFPDTRMHYDKNYVANVGLATYLFAGYEGVICEVVDFFIYEFRYHVARERALTSGQIGKYLGVVLEDAAVQYSSVTKAEMQSIYDTFKYLVDRRNALIHGRPATAPDGKTQVLNYQAYKSHEYLDFMWNIKDVQLLIDEISTAQYAVDAIRMELRDGIRPVAQSVKKYTDMIDQKRKKAP